MSQVYTREFLIDAFMFRFEEYGQGDLKLKALAESFYDKNGKDKFRLYASLDAAEIKRYKEYVQNL